MDRDQEPQSIEPISSEQMEREGWRDEGTLIDESEAPGHTLPESERDRATIGGADKSATPTTMPPPD